MSKHESTAPVPKEFQDDQQEKPMKRKAMTRRRFLGLASMALGAGALAVAGLELLMAGEDQPREPMPIGFPDLTLGDNTMMKRILVAYASAAGSTGGVAETIGRTLAEAGEAVDVRPVQSIPSLDGYHAVVVGSAIHGGKWLAEAVDFVQANQDRLRQMPTAFFLVCLMAANKTESNQKLVAQYLEAQRAQVKPVAEGQFVGALFPNKYPLMTGIGMRFFLAYCGLGLRGGDYRNLDDIRAWSARIHPLLSQ